MHVLTVEGLAHIGGDDDGKFQPLALVDAHDAHDVFPLAQHLGRSQVQPVFLHLVDEAQVAEYPAEARSLILPRPVVQGLQIGLPDGAAGHAADVVVVACITIQFLQRFRHAVPAAVRPPGLQLGAEAQQSFLFLSLFQGCGVCRQVPPQGLLAGQAQLSQRRLVHRRDGRAQDRRHGQILFGIVDAAQKRQDGLYLYGRKIAAVLFRIGRNAISLEDAEQHVRLPGHGSQEHDDMTIGQRLQRAVLAGGHLSLFLQPANRFGDDLAFLLKGRHVPFRRLFICRRVVPRRIDDMHLDRAADPAFVFRGGSSGIEPFPFAIAHTGGFFGHRPGEHFVDGVEDIRSAAEVPSQVDTALHGVGIAAERPVFFQKQRWVRQAEAIDALLDIADHEAVVAAGNQGRNQFLHAVRILIFVDEHFLIGLAQFFRCRRRHGMIRLRLRRQENLQAEMFQIAEIDPALFPFRRPIGLGEISRQPHQPFHDRRHRSHAVQPDVGCNGKIRRLKAFGNFLFHVAAHGLALFPENLIFVRQLAQPL